MTVVAVTQNTELLFTVAAASRPTDKPLIEARAILKPGERATHYPWRI
jgi:hypothetical protein